MSSDDSDSGQGGAGRREVAWRVFAAEYDDADFDYSESDEERAPNYVVTPTGARINRLFVVGVLTEVEQVSDEVLRGRVVDPTGAFVLYAGQYQPDEMAFLESADPPAFVAVTGKARTFQPEDSDRVFTSIRPESINRVDADTRDRWVVQTAEQTLSRVSTFATALDSGERGDALRQALETSGVDAGLSAGIPLAIDHYGTTKEYLAEVWDLAVDSARVVAGEIDADDVGPLELAPDEGGDEVSVDFDYSLTDASELQRNSEERAAEPRAEADDLAEIETEAAKAASESSDEMSPEAETPPAEARTEVGEGEAVSEGSSEPEPTKEVEADSEPVEQAETEADSESVAEAETETEAEPETATSDELGEAPTSSMDESDTEEPPEVEDAEDAAELQEEISDDEPPTVESEQETSTDESFDPETDGEDEGPDLGTAGAGDEMYEFDEEEREQIEEEHGLEFSSGTEVESPGESEMEAPETDVEGEPGDADQHAEPTSDEVDTDELQDVEPAQGGTEEAVGTDEQAPAGGDTAAAEAPGASIGENEIAEGDEVAESDEAVEVEEETETGETTEAEETAEAETGDEGAGGAAEEPENLEDTVVETMRELNEGDGVERETLLAAVVQEYDVTPADVEDALEAALMAGQCYESGDDTFKPI